MDIASGSMVKGLATSSRIVLITLLLIGIPLFGNAAVNNKHSVHSKIQKAHSRGAPCDFLLTKSPPTSAIAHCNVPEHEARTQSVLAEFNQRYLQGQVQVGVGTCRGECGVVIYSPRSSVSSYDNWIFNTFYRPGSGDRIDFTSNQGITVPVCASVSSESYDEYRRSIYPQCNKSSRESDAFLRRREQEASRNARRTQRQSHGGREINIDINLGGGDGGGGWDPRGGMIQGTIPADSANGR